MMELISHDPVKYEIWHELLKREWIAYKQSPVGVFSVDGYIVAEEVGRLINQYNPKTCLDIGCGCLSLPTYMKTAKDVKWFGVDPLAGDQLRQFNFLRGCAENLPYSNNFFHSVLFASSIDHLLDPCIALREAWRVLKSGAYIFIWFTNRVNAPAYKKQGRIPFNKMHLWGFNDIILRQIIEQCGFSVKEIKILDSQECLLIGNKKHNAND